MRINKLKIIIPSYNHEKYIEQCIKSVLKQSKKNYDLKVVDDGSKDRSDLIIKKLQKINNFEYTQKVNEGLIKTLNGEIEKINDNYDYISIIASDDVFMENRVEVLNWIIENENLKNIGAIFTGYKIIDENGNEKYTKKYEKIIRLTEEEYFGYRWLAAPTAFINVGALKAVGGYSSNYEIEDFYLWHKLLSKGYQILVVPEVTVAIRKHSSNMSGDRIKMLKQEIKILSEYGLSIKVFKAMARSVLSTIKSYIRG